MIFSATQLHLVILCTLSGFGNLEFGEMGGHRAIGRSAHRQTLTQQLGLQTVMYPELRTKDVNTTRPTNLAADVCATPVKHWWSHGGGSGG